MMLRKLMPLIISIVCFISKAYCCTSIDAVPITISKPGNYCLRKELIDKDPLSSAIIINSDNVLVDLQGHDLKASTLTESHSSGIESYNHSNIVIKNGTIKNFMYGVRIQETDLMKLKNDYPNATHNIQVSNLKLEFNTFRGVSLAAGDSEVNNSKVYSTGGTTVFPDSFSMAIEVWGHSCNVSQNIIRDVYPIGVGEGVGISISKYGEGCKIQGNKISNHFLPALGRTFGIWIGPLSKNSMVISENNISGFSYAGNINRPKEITLSNNKFNQMHCDNFYGMGEAYYRNKKVCYEEDTHMDLVRASKGDPSFLYKLGMEYLEGYWVRKNLEKSYYYFNLAAHQGCAEALRVKQVYVKPALQKTRPRRPSVV